MTGEDKNLSSVTGQKRKQPSTGTLFCEICNVHYPPNNEEKHKGGKKHQLLEDIRKKQEAKASRSIFVRNMPAGVNQNELRDYFLKFGHVSRVNMTDKGYCFVEFTRPVDELEVLKVKHNLRDQELVVKQSNVSQRPKEHNVFVTFDITKNPQIISKLRDVASFDNQVKTLLSLIQLTEAELLRRGDFVASLSRSIQEYFPGCRLEVFGSTANGLGFTGCDIDLTLFLSIQREESRTLTLERQDVPMPYDVHFGRFPRENLNHLSRENILFFLTRLIQRLPGYKFAKFIPSLRCPIIKFRHHVTNICGDISFSKSLGIANTQLLRLYGQLDFRVYALLMILRFWGKREQFVGSNHMITSYAFSWLVIFYLQRKNLLPTVETLASLSELKMDADGWDCSFCENIDIIPAKVKEKTLGELIIGFFEFYANFDFTINVICPRDGSCAVKSELVAEAGDQLDFKITSMSVQDVFDLTHNITGSVNDTTLQIFLSKCNEQHSGWKTVGNPNNINLMYLFDTTSVLECSVPPSFAAHPAPVFDAPVPVSVNEFLLWAPPVPATAPQVSQLAAPHYDKVAAYLSLVSRVPFDIAKACSLVLDIFKRAFHFDLKSINSSPEYSIHSSSPVVRTAEETPSKKRKMSAEDEGFILSVSCTAYYRTWVGRKAVTNVSLENRTVSQLYIEEGIAKQIILFHGPKLRPPYVFDVKFYMCPEKHNMKIVFLPVTKKNEVICNLVPFVKKFIVNFIPDITNLFRGH